MRLLPIERTRPPEKRSRSRVQTGEWALAGNPGWGLKMERPDEHCCF
jgi:hypothetical protein